MSWKKSSASLPASSRSSQKSFLGLGFKVLGGSWVVISRVINRITTIITHIRGVITSLITTHESSK